MSLPLERVVYVSRATSPHAEAMLNLIQILAVSQRNNARDEITGALALSRGRFLQVIEGRPSDLDRLLKRLETAGLVDRRRNPEDERQVVVAPTARGAALETRAGCLLEELLKRSGLTVAQIADLNARVRTLTQAVSRPVADRPT